MKRKQLSERFFFFFFILDYVSGFFQFTEQHRTEGIHPCFSLSLTPTHKHKHGDIYLQLYIWNVYLLFLIAAHVLTRLLLDEIYPPVEINIRLNVTLPHLLINFKFDVINILVKNGEFELPFTITIVFITNATIHESFTYSPATQSIPEFTGQPPCLPTNLTLCTVIFT